MIEYLERQCDDLVARLGAAEPPAERARRVVRRTLGREPVTLGEVARRCALSPRALQRALADDDTTFTALLEEERRRAAFEALGRGEPVERVSARIGFRDARAFRRWTGGSPREWRRARAPE